MLLWNAGGSQLSDPDRHKQATVKVLDYIYWLHVPALSTLSGQKRDITTFDR